MTEAEEIPEENTQEKTVRANHEDEVKNLMDSYGKILDVWKVHNDNYFKRVQIFMGLLQAGLFLAALKLLFPLPESFTEALIAVFLGIMGIGSAWLWIGLNRKQNQYFEFCRRTLRNLESRLASLGVPLEYFTSESLVFGPHQECPPALYSAATEIVPVGKDKRHLLRFLWSKESYPESVEYKGPHSIKKVRGGMLSYEKRLAHIALWVWVFVSLSVVSVAYIHSKSECADARSDKVGMEAQPIRSADDGGCY
jgi:hypothetical protein